VKRDNRLWDAALIAGGVLAAGITLRAYHGFTSPSGPPSRHKLSPQEAQGVADSTKAYLATHPEDYNAWAYLAMASFHRGTPFYAEGLNAVDKARALGATSDTLFYYAGVMYDALGLPEYAVNELSKYLRHYPEDYEVRVRLANLYIQEKRFDDAGKIYQSLTKQRPKEATIWFNLAVLDKEKGDYEGALACFHRAQEIAGRLPEGGIFMEGEIAKIKGDDDQAIRLYQQELASHPRYLPAWVSLEAVQRKKGLWKDARDSRKQVAELKSNESL
jgi:tetratricopeptide (TPR) repeat protein